MRLHDSMIRRIQSNNVALHAHENVAPWPQGFMGDGKLNNPSIKFADITQKRLKFMR